MSKEKLEKKVFAYLKDGAVVDLGKGKGSILQEIELKDIQVVKRGRGHNISFKAIIGESRESETNIAFPTESMYNETFYDYDPEYIGNFLQRALETKNILVIVGTESGPISLDIYYFLI